MKRCQQELIAERLPHPRTCEVCGLGPCMQAKPFKAKHGLWLMQIDGQPRTAIPIDHLMQAIEHFDFIAEHIEGLGIAADETKRVASLLRGYLPGEQA